MGDSFSEVSYNSYGSRLMKSVGGAVVGAVLVLASFPVLWWNEGRTNFADVAKKSEVISANASGSDGEGKLVSVTGPLAAIGTVGDPQYLRAGNHLALHREVEMYAWHETKKEKEEKQVGGSSKTITTYEYEKEWTSHPQSSSEFRIESGHENPSLSINSQTWYASSAKLGAFTFDPAKAELPGMKKYTPSGSEYLTAGVQRGNARGGRGYEAGPQPMGEYLFQGRGSLSSPVVGDVRISFETVDPMSTATIFGRREGAQIMSASIGGDESFFRVLEGSREQAIEYLQTEHTVITWLLRLVGFLMMWLGSAAVFGPLNTFLDIIPMVGGAGRFLVSVVLFPITLVITTLVILVSIVAHSLILMSIVAIAAIGGTIFFFKKRHANAPRPNVAPGV